MALVRPLLEYSNSVWDPYQKELINKIENIQKKAARFTTNTYDKTTSITQLIKDLIWDTLQNRGTANRLTILHKARQGHLALPVENLLQPSLRQSQHSHPESFQIITSTKNCHKYSYLPRTVIDWNGLPYSIIQIRDSTSFKVYVPTCIHLFPHARADTIQVVEHEQNFSKFYQLTISFLVPQFCTLESSLCVSSSDY